MSNKTSDKNVANIEIVIKDCREHLKLYGEAFITANELDRIESILSDYIRQKQKIKDKIEEIDKRLDFIKIELKKLYIENETIGTETEIDNNEYYIYNLEKEQELRHSQKTILQELLQKSEDK